MSFQSSRTENIKTLFHGNRFVIPNYQRKYSWGFEQRKALWDDINENLLMNHFIGTLCFKRSEKQSDIVNDVYEIIDGQQRISTLFIMLNVLIELIEDIELKKQYATLFIGDKDLPKLTPLGIDEEFMNRLIFQYDSIDFSQLNSRSQINLYKAKQDFYSLYKDYDQETIIAWTQYISQKIDILIFNVVDEAQAVKMFTVINDRGLPLNNIDKTKSTLMLYSTLCLNSELNNEINESFGVIFDSIDNLLLRKNRLGVFSRLDDLEFENTFFTHHYYSCRHLFPDWDYQLGADSIYKHLKRNCEELKIDSEKLTVFIRNYIDDLVSFSNSYADLFKEIAENEEYKVLFLYMEFTATLYPLIVRLYEQKKLDKLLSLLETVETRVYKLKNTNPRSNMYKLASIVNEKKPEIQNISDQLKYFCTSFMNDHLISEYFNYGVDNKLALVKYILYEFNKKLNGQSLSLEEYKELQVEHIFSQTPNFSVKKYGFNSTEIYDKQKTKIGNLSLIEANINKTIRNFSPVDKASGYEKSVFRLNSQLMGELFNFNIKKIDSRSKEFISFFLSRFPIGNSVSEVLVEIENEENA